MIEDLVNGALGGPGVWLLELVVENQLAIVSTIVVLGGAVVFRNRRRLSRSMKPIEEKET